LTATKSVDPATPAPGERAHFTLTITNNGSASAQNVVVRDVLSSYLQYVGGTTTLDGQPQTDEADADGTTASLSEVQVRLDSLAPGASAVLQFRAEVVPDVPANTAVPNAATVSYEDPDGTPLPAVGSNTVILRISPRLGVDIEADQTRYATTGESVVFPLTVTNLGNETDTLNLTAATDWGFEVELRRDVNGNGQLDNEDLPLEDTNGDGAVDVGEVDAGEQAFLLAVVHVSEDAEDGSPEQVQVTDLTTVQPPTPSQVRFTDATGNDVAAYAPGETVYVEVRDADENRDAQQIETVAVVLTDPLTGDRETLPLTETGPSTGIFVGSVPSAWGEGRVEDGTLQLFGGETLTVAYSDPNDPTDTGTDTALIPLEATPSATHFVDQAGQDVEVFLAGDPIYVRTEGHRALVVFTDGRDNVSQRSPEDLLALVREVQLPLYAIGFGPEADQERLTHLAETSGGRACFPTTLEELRASFRQILAELR